MSLLLTGSASFPTSLPPLSEQPRGEFLSPPFLCSRMELFPWETVLQKRNPVSSPVSPSHRLQFCMTCSSMALLGSQLPCHQSFARYTHYILLLGSAMSSAHHFLESFPVSLLSCHCVYLPRKWCQFTEVQCLYKSAFC